MALRGELTIPGDKSMSHRSLMFSALSAQQSEVTGLLESADVLATEACLKALGATISHDLTTGRRLITGGVPFQEPNNVLDCQNSGTTIRLLTGLITGKGGYTAITGDDSLRKRPMKRVIDPLTQMGAHIRGRDNNRLCPITLLPTENPIQGIHYPLPMASAQVKSAVLLAGLLAQGETNIVEPAPSRDHTERMLQAMGVPLTVDGLTITLTPMESPNFQARQWQVPGDFSSAAFWLVAASLIPGSELTLHHVNLNPRRTGLLDLLLDAGANITVENQATVGGESVGTLCVRSADLIANWAIDGAMLPRLIDEVPILSVAALYLKGTLTVTEAEELRAKETDRIALMADNLTALGATVHTTEDGLQITGQPDWAAQTPTTPLVTGHDHRIAMAMAILHVINQHRSGSAQAVTPWPIDHPQCVAVSYPTFFDHLGQVCPHSPMVQSVAAV